KNEKTGEMCFVTKKSNHFNNSPNSLAVSSDSTPLHRPIGLMRNQGSLLPKVGELASDEVGALKVREVSEIGFVRPGAAILHKLNDKCCDGNEEKDVNHTSLVQQKLFRKPNCQQD
ncbi:MAG TPA: hypothetical protein VHD88_04455, partial [Pyrinomonadaceae bacterium]|nr:hypothetical protein [Pyrinomonadaceae bacterium]